MPKTIFNIFAKQQQEKVIKNNHKNKPKVIADFREKNSFVGSELVNLGVDIEFRHLKVADFIVKDIAIERKTISDFASSMINKRLLRQLEEMQQYEKRLLMIEGLEEQELYNDDLETEKGINPNAIRGFLLTILLTYKVPIIFTKNQEDTAKYIAVIAKKKSKQEISLNVKKKSLNKKQQMRYIIEGFPGIGPKTAKKLLQEFGTIKNIVNAPIEKLQELIGKKSDIFKIVEDKY